MVFRHFYFYGQSRLYNRQKELLMKYLRPIRIIIAAVFFVGLFFAFMDFRGDLPTVLAKGLASVQLIPALMSFTSGVVVSGLIFLVLAGVTLLFGRVYCSAICPLGIFQDIVRRVKMLFPKKKKPLQKYQPAKNVIRHAFFWMTVASGVVGLFIVGGSIVFALLDPYSIFGRIISDLFQPIAVALNNLLTVFFNERGMYGIYYVKVNWFGFGVITLPLIFLTLVVVMSFLRGRLYCNTVCPVGTFLGLIAKHAAFRLVVNESRCRHCTQCQRQCKAECIDSRQGMIDMSRCVACYDCIKVCDDDAIQYKFCWGKSHTDSSPLKTEGKSSARPAKKSSSSVDWNKRGFIHSMLSGSMALGTLAFFGGNRARKRKGYSPEHGKDDKLPIFPPGGENVANFLDSCTACHLCVTACPTHVLQPAFMEYGLGGFMKPHFDVKLGFCNFECTKCGEVCPTDAIRHLALEQKKVTRVGVATFHQERCIVFKDGTDCAACSEHCPTKAVDTIPFRVNLLLPKVNPSLCIGCGACEHACPVRPDRAITVSGIMEHEMAEKVISKKAVENVPDEFLF